MPQAGMQLSKQATADTLSEGQLHDDPDFREFLKRISFSASGPDPLQHTPAQAAEAILADEGLKASWKQYKFLQGQRAVLMPEEIAFFQKVKSSGKLEKMNAVREPSLSSIGPRHVLQAWEDLSQDTAATQKALDAQRAHLNRLRAAIHSANSCSEEARSSHDSKLKSMQEKQRVLEKAVGNAEADIIKHRAGTLANLANALSSKDLQRNKSSKNNILSTAAKVPRIDVDDQGSSGLGLDFAEYDSLLRKLGDLGRELESKTPDDDKVILAARQYAHEEVFMLVQACRGVVNAAFIAASQTGNNDAHRTAASAQAVEEEMVAVVQEIQSLWDEVVPVAHMATERQMLDPIMRRINTQKDKAERHRAVILTYVISCLEFMNQRLEVLADRIRVALHYYSCHFMIGDTTASSKTVINKPARLPIQLDTIHERLKSITQSQVPFKLDPLEPLPAQVAKFEEYIQQRTVKRSETLLKQDRMFQTAVKTGLHENESVSQQLLDCVVAECVFDGSNRRGQALQDGQIEETIGFLKEELTKIQELLANLNLRAGFCDGDELKTPVALWPQLLSALQSLESETHSQAPSSSTQRINSLKATEFLRRWGDISGMHEETGK